MNLRRIHDISLKWKLVIPFLFLSFVGTISLVLLSLHNQNRLIEIQEKRKLFDYYRTFLDQIEDRKRSALSLACQVAHSPEVQKAFAKRDRQALIDLLLPSYRVLSQKFGVKQFHFHLRPATSFLRLHRINQYGEKMSAFRQTINVVEKSGKGIAGLEWGITGFAVRGVAPVYYRGEMIGTFEVGYSVEHTFLESLRRRYQMELAVLVPQKGGNGFLELATSSTKMALLGQRDLKQVFESRSPEVLLGPPAAPRLAVLLGPLRAFSGGSIGVVEIQVDRAATLAQMARNRNLMVAVMIGALALSFTLIWWVVVLFLRPVHKIVGIAQEIAAGKRVRRIEVPVHDEIGTLADSLNDMLASLNQARWEIQRYCETLEERVRARTWELVEEKEKYETLVENAPLVVYRLMPDGTTVFVNRFVEELLGYRPAEVIDDRDFWSRTAHAEDREQVEKLLQSCLSEGQQCQLEYRGLHKNGTEVFLLNMAMPLRDDQGLVKAIDGIVVDVTERKRLQEKVIQTEELKTLSEISARLAHEIRNPLTSAGGFARRLLQEMEPQDPHREKVEIIVQEISRLEQILKMIISYIQPLTLEFSEVNLNGLLEEVAAVCQERLRSREISLELELDRALPSIQADRSHLGHAIRTILQNACDHMPERSRLRISTSYNEAAVVQFSYPALHLAEDDLDHFFYPFVPGELDETDLELPLTKVVIHRHGGIVSISRSEPDQIIITISFPLAAARGERRKPDGGTAGGKG